jgi:hypothetical protein
MQNSFEWVQDTQSILDSFGAEPLDGSGFETEPCDPDFTGEGEE